MVTVWMGHEVRQSHARRHTGVTQAFLSLGQFRTVPLGSQAGEGILLFA